MKQTAVEWLIKELNLEGYDHTIEQAKAMEKEQIMDAYNNGDLRSAELYYNETYVGSNSVCTCTNFRETPMINGKYICSICNKPITKEDKQ